MIFRKHNYDALPITIQGLQEKMKIHRTALDNIIEKADINDKDRINIAIVAFEDVNDTAATVYEQFVSMRTDFQMGAINEVRYKDGLKKLKDLLINTDEKIKIDALHSDEIAEECKRYLAIA